MFLINEDKSIYITRGDTALFQLKAMRGDVEQHKFQAGDVIRLKVFEKKACENVVLQKDFPVEEETEVVGIYLEEADTKIGDVISKPKDYWYEVELNPDTCPQTIIGYDEDGAKVFKLFPEGVDVEDLPVEEDSDFERVIKGTVTKWLDENMTVSDEQVAQAVENYFEENPVSGGATAEQLAQINTNKENIDKISEEKVDKDYVNEAIKNVNGGAVVGRFFGKNANFLGDSQTDDAGNYKSKFFYDWLKEILGLSATNNYGYSGTTIMPISGQTRSFLERYSSMSNDADLIVVWGGTNDYHYGHALGTVDDTGNTTFCGALNSLCKGLITKYPQKDILFVTPTPRGNISTAVATQKEYADAIIEVCGKYCIPVFDAFRKCNMPIIADVSYDGEGNIIRKYTVDGLHLNDLGHEILGKSMANFILYGEMAGIQKPFNNNADSGNEGEEDGEGGEGGDTTISVTGITLNTSELSLTVGETAQLTATVEPTNATNKNIVWSASNGNCTVNNGLVTAITDGDCTITATTEDGSFSANCSVIIEEEEVVVDAPTSPVDGKTVTFTGAGSWPANANNITLLVNSEDCSIVEDGKITVNMEIAEATQTITAFGKGMQAFNDETGELNNGKYKSDTYSDDYVTSELSGNKIVATAHISENASKLTYDYVKIPVSIVTSAYPVSFKIESLTVDVNGDYIPIQKVGGFYADEGYSVSE